MQSLPSSPLRKRSAAILMILAMALGGEAFGAEFRTGRRYSLPEEEIVSENLYVAAGEAVISGHVLGALLCLTFFLAVLGALYHHAWSAARTSAR